VGYAAGKIVKGGAWIIKNLKKSRKEVIEGKGQFSKLNPMEQEQLKWELNALIKQLERGGAIPDDMIQTMRQDKRFKDIVKTPSTDTELRELEEVLLGKTDMDRMRDIEQKINLEEFDVTGKTKHASGGIAGQLHLNRPGYFAGDVVDPEGYNISRRELGILANADPSKEEMIRKFLNRIKHHKPIYPDRILEINRGRRAGAKGGLAKVLGV